MCLFDNFFHFFVNSIDPYSGNFTKAPPLGHGIFHRLKKCRDWGFSSQLGGKSHTEIYGTAVGSISWIDRTFIASSTGQTMVI